MARTYRSIPEPVYARKSNELVKEDGSVVSVDNLQEKLTAGTNITIDENNVISATAGGGGGIEYVVLGNASSGTITNEQATKISNGAFIKMGNKYFYPCDSYAKIFPSTNTGYIYATPTYKESRGNLTSEELVISITNLTFKVNTYQYQPLQQGEN